MSNIFEKENAVSPNSQLFMWAAEYDNGDIFSEFDLLKKNQNLFKNINKDMVVRFGFIGQNMVFTFNVYGGTFLIEGIELDIVYQQNKDFYHLTSQKTKYNNIVCFKDAYVDLNPFLKSNSKSVISQYNFGYKKNLVFDEKVFIFNPICEIPINDYVRMNFSISSNVDMNGDLLILKNKKVFDKIHAPLNKNMDANFVWTLK